MSFRGGCTGGDDGDDGEWLEDREGDPLKYARVRRG